MLSYFFGMCIINICLINFREYYFRLLPLPPSSFALSPSPSLSSPTRPTLPSRPWTDDHLESRVLTTRVIGLSTIIGLVLVFFFFFCVVIRCVAPWLSCTGLRPRSQPVVNKCSNWTSDQALCLVLFWCAACQVNSVSTTGRQVVGQLAHSLLISGRLHERRINSIFRNKVTSCLLRRVNCAHCDRGMLCRRVFYCQQLGCHRSINGARLSLVCRSVYLPFCSLTICLSSCWRVQC